MHTRRYVVFVPVLLGMVFGLALQRGRVTEFYFIRNQMLMSR